MRLIVYLDLLALINFFMNYILLWATGNLNNQTYRSWRIIIASLVGTIYTIIVVLPIFINLDGLISHFLVSILMLNISFAPFSLKKLIKLVGYLYLITFTTAGAIFAIYNLTGSRPLDSLAYVFNLSVDKIWVILFGALIVYLIGKFGWLLIQQKILPEIFCLPTIIKLKNNKIKIKALVDTGNQLRDPLTRVPVIVVEFKAVENLFSEEIQQIFKDDLAQQELLNKIINTELADRFRLVPFSSLGESDGMLIGFRPDMVVVKSKQEIFMVKKVIIALKMGGLNLEEDYQGLLNPALFSKVME